ncbi:sulfite exporter TauE/SafE family protein [Microbacterium sp. NPDC089698]|uniref:sulfite exporter TauE/SafE family protein n=1 Tax=Microbacterium sp. NPDC089698 TaxID=3364200 RepID=UPI00380FA0FD
MIILTLLLIGAFAGLTTVLFGFGGGFVTVPVIVWADAAAGSDAGTIAVATSAVVMVVNAAIATAATPVAVLGRLRGRRMLLLLLAVGGLSGAAIASVVPAAVVSWGFIAYLAVTIVDVSVRPGFFTRATRASAPRGTARIPSSYGLPIGAVASVLGVGGSVMTVPLLRRSGLPMSEATALANPLTLALSLPASIAFLALPHAAPVHAPFLSVGLVDIGAAALLLAGAIPVIVVLRRHPLPIPDRVHAWTYLALLVTVLAAMLASLW